MSNRIIRFGGSQSGNKAVIKNLTLFLSRYENRNFIITSAIPEILDIIFKSLRDIFIAGTDSRGRLAAIFRQYTGQEDKASYLKLTDQLTDILRGIQLIGDYSPALKDQILSFSEKLTAEILQTNLHTLGIDAGIIWPEEIELLSTSDFGSATYSSVSRKKAEAGGPGYYLIPGSYGITEDNKIARAGITASDYTAAFLAIALGSPQLELWGMDRNFYRADISIIQGSPLIKRLTYSEAGELAYFDHYSFHPRTVEPLEPGHIPIHILNMNSDDGDIESIINTETYVEEQIVKSVACTDDISLLRLNGPGVGLKPGILAKVTLKLNDAGINIKSVITSQTSINIILEKQTGKRALELLQGLGFTAVKDITVIENVSLIGVVGHGMQNSYGVSAKIFGAVAKSKINVI
ncbi:MAG: ACT domain-containing protein, partial [Prolixibacteraceae bacterium]|nr:ACT domain-containing protein [Prolixibacteraceae bacterium]